MPPVARIAATALIDALVDEGTFREWLPTDLQIPGELDRGVDEYSLELQSAREQTGRRESVVAGDALIGGIRAALVVGDFDFLAGSVGREACQLVIAAFVRAQQLGLPVFASPSSGGTRMQEGTRAFVLMADVAASIHRFRDAGNLLVVWLRNPTTGGVMATWGSLGSVTFGEPGALVGFLGPRVFEMLSGDQFPPGVQVTENLARCGVIDAVVPLEHLRDDVQAVLKVASGSEPTSGVSMGGAQGTRDDSVFATGNPDPWHCVLKTREPDRPTAVALIAENVTAATRLHGTGAGERGDAVALCLGRWRGISAVIVAQDRLAQSAGDHLGPAALRTARRGFRLAAELGLPLVTVVDTPGAELSVAAEEGALAGEIARCLADLTTLNVPTVSVLLGMGCGGGALALLPGDRVVAAENAWVSPLPLEGASIIRHRTPEKAAQMARDQKVAAWQLAEAGIVDVVVAERPDAAREPGEFLERLGTVVQRELLDLIAQDSEDRRTARDQRYRGGLRGV